MRPAHSAPYYGGSTTRQSVAVETNRILAKNVIEPATVNWVAFMIFAPKKNGSHNFCFDYWNLNAVSICASYPSPSLAWSNASTALERWQYSFHWSLIQSIAKLKLTRVTLAKQRLSPTMACAGLQGCRWVSKMPGDLSEGNGRHSCHCTVTICPHVLRWHSPFLELSWRLY